MSVLPKVRMARSRRMITLEVRRTERISPTFLTVTLGGPQAAHLEPMGFDQTVRLFFPRAGQDGLRMPSRNSEAWMAEVLLMPKASRPRVRNYTVRRVRPEADEVDIEFALHGDSPASAWARGVRPGDPAGLFDMGVTYLPPEDAAWQFLAGDESALPAVLAILDHAPASLTGEVFLEVPDSADFRTDVTAPEGVTVHWLARDGAAPGTAVLEAVRGTDLPPGRGYVWVAGESRLATGVRRHLVRDRAVPKADVAFHGYWREGRPSLG
ncbi:siderophore-interacting protein [Streptomyces sp. CRN 30]|uniref:siderophore-interacting protein n=1 Tax=Streptomyces sp. CRN 30 TaxID=3075613 RepID=UPI002A7F9D21|nr:siderophore-interacting protein [Streptomyces sp. CRN 30]